MRENTVKKGYRKGFSYSFICGDIKGKPVISVCENMETTILVNSLCKSYGRIPAVKNLDLSVNRGEVFGLLGANGAGKSTTIECILGTKKRDSGTVSILKMDPRKDRKKLFERVGVQFQEANYQEKITVRELCQETYCLYKNPSHYEDLLNQFGLKDKTNRMVNELSGGERQRLFVVAALIPRPEVVFLDELTSGLDTKARRSVWKCLLELKISGLTIFLTSHSMEEVENLCDRIGILKDGSLVFCGTIQEAITAASCEKLEDAYLWFTGEEEYYENI